MKIRFKFGRIILFIHKEHTDSIGIHSITIVSILQILDDVISADFYIAVPDILSKLLPLKNKLRKKFPKNKRGKLSVQVKLGINCRWSTAYISFLLGSVGVHIPQMLELFKTGHEYLVESDCYIRTQIATVRLIVWTHEDPIFWQTHFSPK